MGRAMGRAGVALALVILGGPAPVLADKPSWAGHGKGDAGERHGRGEHGDRREHGERREHGRHGHRFDDRDRVVVRDWYRDQYRGGRCPPGLAKKHNGCLPPGQAKKWVVGRPLPRSVVYYEVPPPLVVQLGVPPPGYRYVRVASDILMIAVGTGLIMDAIEDLGR